MSIILRGMRLVKVSLWELTDQEPDELTLQCEATEPGYAAELRRLEAWRREHPAPPPMDERGRGYPVVAQARRRRAA